MITRRTFLRYAGGAALISFAFNAFGIPKAIAIIPGGSLEPTAITWVQTPLLIPPVMSTAGSIVLRGERNIRQNRETTGVPTSWGGV